MEQKTLHVLEFNKITAMLSEKAVIAATSEHLSSLTPSADILEIRRALNETDEARRLTAKQGTAPLSPVSDIRASVKRSVIKSSLTNSELLNIAAVLRTARAMAQYSDIKDFEADYPLLNEIFSSLIPKREIEREIGNAIISEDEIDDNASPALSAIRRKMAQTSNKIKDILDGIIKSSQYAQILQEPIITMRSGRYVVPVKSEHKSSFPGVVHDTSQTGATLFIEPIKVVDANNEIRRLAAEEKEEINRILAELSALVADNADDILADYGCLLKLDFIFAKAALADDMRASMPAVNEDGVTDIKKARHPLIDKNKVVPIDIRLGEDFDTLVITGPNTGGKTVTLKTLGLLTLMTQAGLHIPAAEGSKIAVFENIFADIGDEQSIEQSLSTFSAHMVNIVSILSKVDYKSLVLFDELGAGTDPTEGAALAIAILKEVRAKGARTAATTHYSEIKMYALTTEGVENAACEFDVATLRPTYRLLIGALGRSNAFAIAARLGMSRDVIQSAKDMITAENTRFEDVVSNLEGNRQLAEEARAEAEKYRLEAERLKNEYIKETEAAKKNREKIIDEARREAKRLLSDAKAEIDRQLKLAASSRNDPRALNEAKNEIKKKLQKVSDELADNALKPAKSTVKPSDIKPGTTVRIDAMNQVGTALKAPDKDGNIEVQIGIMKVKTHISTISLVKDNSLKNVERTYIARKSTSGNMPEAVKTEIDLRGQNSDEACLRVEKFIDDASLAHLEKISIIHGKGTGVLRSAIHSLLRQNKAVKSFRLGRYGEGETGVTIVELK